MNAVKLGRSINLKHPILDDGRNRDDDANRLRPMISQTNLKRFTTLRIVPRKRLATNGWSNLVTVSRGRKMAGRKWLTKYGCGCPRLATCRRCQPWPSRTPRQNHGRGWPQRACYKTGRPQMPGHERLATNDWAQMLVANASHKRLDANGWPNPVHSLPCFNCG